MPFFPGDPRPVVQKFVQGFSAKFGAQPDAYNGRAYDTFILLAAVMRQFGAERGRSRRVWQDQGCAERRLRHRRFDPATRRVANPFVSRIMVKDGKWAAWDGKTRQRSSRAAGDQLWRMRRGQVSASRGR